MMNENVLMDRSFLGNVKIIYTHNLKFYKYTFRFNEILIAYFHPKELFRQLYFFF